MQKLNMFWTPWTPYNDILDLKFTTEIFISLLMGPCHTAKSFFSLFCFALNINSACFLCFVTFLVEFNIWFLPKNAKIFHLSIMQNMQHWHNKNNRSYTFHNSIFLSITRAVFNDAFVLFQWIAIVKYAKF